MQRGGQHLRVSPASLRLGSVQGSRSIDLPDSQLSRMGQVPSATKLASLTRRMYS